ncbi:MAG: acetyl-CoA carboxylase biotin carboxylase subunit, partial [Polyangiaceae bacterium]|nr:acetyl-CoA carboxylase biotin carboxylase subunit [Polyangiaceae bacterium]
LPSPGTIAALRPPSGPWVRDDGGFYEGSIVPSHYDPLISKLSVWAPDRPRAIARMQRALAEYVVTGIRTNLSFHQNLLASPEFQAGRYHTGFIAEHAGALCGYAEIAPADEPALAAALAVAASRAERRASSGARADDVADAGAGRSARVSPWVLHHRSFR